MIATIVSGTLLLCVMIFIEVHFVAKRVEELQRRLGKLDRNWRWEHGDKAYDDWLGKEVER